MDASGRYGPALLDGTDHHGTIIGSDGTTPSAPALEDDVVVRVDDDFTDKVNGGDGFGDGLLAAGDELANCEDQEPSAASLR